MELPLSRYWPSWRAEHHWHVKWSCEGAVSRVPSTTHTDIIVPLQALSPTSAYTANLLSESGVYRSMGTRCCSACARVCVSERERERSSGLLLAPDQYCPAVPQEAWWEPRESENNLDSVFHGITLNEMLPTSSLVISKLHIMHEQN